MKVYWTVFHVPSRIDRKPRSLISQLIISPSIYLRRCLPCRYRRSYQAEHQPREVESRMRRQQPARARRARQFAVAHVVSGAPLCGGASPTWLTWGAPIGHLTALVHVLIPVGETEGELGVTGDLVDARDGGHEQPELRGQKVGRILGAAKPLWCCPRRVDPTPDDHGTVIDHSDVLPDSKPSKKIGSIVSS